VTSASVISWRHALLVSLLAAAALHVASWNVLAQTHEHPSLLDLATSPPSDGWLPWFVALAVAGGAIACFRRSPPWIISSLGALIGLGFFEVLRFAAIPPKTFDFRVLYCALVAHSIAWGSYALVIASAAIGWLERRASSRHERT
jgi:hypothetical protein